MCNHLAFNFNHDLIIIDLKQNTLNKYLKTIFWLKMYQNLLYVNIYSYTYVSLRLSNSHMFISKRPYAAWKINGYIYLNVHGVP